MQIAADYAGLDLVLVAPLKGSLFFAADLSRAIPSVHELAQRPLLQNSLPVS